MMMFALLFAIVFAARFWVTVPRAPSATLIGPSAEAQEEAAKAEKMAKDEAALLGFLTVLRNAAGPGAKDCGALKASDKSNDVISCGAEQLSSQTPFSLAVALHGVDTTIWTGLVRDGNAGFCSLPFCAILGFAIRNWRSRE